MNFTFAHYVAESLVTVVANNMSKQKIHSTAIKAGGDKGRATQQHAAGNMTSGNKAVIHAQADRVIGHNFHSYPKDTK
jgi:hypothetical protein